jgi:hypothetical protein
MLPVDCRIVLQNCWGNLQIASSYPFFKNFIFYIKVLSNGIIIAAFYLMTNIQTMTRLREFNMGGLDDVLSVE